MTEDNTQKPKKRSQKESIELVIFVVVAIALAYGLNVGIRAYSGSETSLVVVETGSMQPTLVGIYVFDGETHTTTWSPFSGDDLFVKQMPANELQLGDIIVFEDPRGGEIPIVHRIVEKYEKEGIYYFRTSGDNPWTNKQVDWWEVRQDHIIGKVIARVPRIGYFHLSIQTSFGRLILLVAIVGLIASMFLFPEKSEDEQGPEEDRSSSHEKGREVRFKDVFYAFLILLVIITPVLANTMEMTSSQTEGQILAVDLRRSPAADPQLSVKISLWSGGYFWHVLDRADIFINAAPSSFLGQSPEFVWTSPFRWRGTKIISADFFIGDFPQGTPVIITLKTYYHNSLGEHWTEEVEISITT